MVAVSPALEPAQVLSEGYDDSTWPLEAKTGTYEQSQLAPFTLCAGEVRLILHHTNAKKPETCFTPAPQYAAPVPYASLYSAPPPASVAAYAAPAATNTTPSPYLSYPSNSAYPPSAYPSPPTAYPPSQYRSPSPYPPPYPPPPHASPYYPPVASYYSAFPGLHSPPQY
ncbi:hypothetical protein P3X46_013850 [Hevea brasiliensis]|uniref:Uncharacterized protein n=1 Tax=Hevea brasiliensis TaxID=3981 RepID=A0ABQ9M769_HEVBR|nr:hypothetical protein P3X46_013850 [Hevea brasiliensis]